MYKVNYAIIHQILMALAWFDKFEVFSINDKKTSLKDY